MAGRAFVLLCLWSKDWSFHVTLLPTVVLTQRAFVPKAASLLRELQSAASKMSSRTAVLYGHDMESSDVLWKLGASRFPLLSLTDRN